MYIFSVFELTEKIEEAMTALTTKGIPKEAILAVPLNSRNESHSLFDTVHYSDNQSSLALPFIVATICTLLGGVWGFQFYLGPIVWSLIGAFFGFGAGFIATLIRNAHKKHSQRQAHKANVVVVVECDPAKSELVQDILWSSTAIGVNTVALS